jgi:hypothetical protein
MSFAKVVLAPFGSALTILKKEKKYVCGSAMQKSVIDRSACALFTKVSFPVFAYL